MAVDQSNHHVYHFSSRILNPQLAKSAYISNLSKTIDFAITYFVVVTLTYFTISYIRKNYDLEKDAVMEKNVAIEEQKGGEIWFERVVPRGGIEPPTP